MVTEGEAFNPSGSVPVAVMESISSNALRIVLIIFGYLPIDKWGIIGNLFNWLLGIFQLISPLLNKQFWNQPVKSWLYFTILYIYVNSICCLGVHVEFFLNRKKIATLKRRLFTNSYVKLNKTKYIILIILNIFGCFIFLHRKPVKLVIRIAMYYWISVWNMRLILLIMAFDMQKLQLRAIYKEVRGMVNPRKETYIRLLKEYTDIHDITEEINKRVRFTLAATVIEFVLLVINICYWGLLGLVKNLKYVDNIRK